MSKMQKFKAKAAKAANWAKSEGGAQKIGTTALIVTEISTHALLALASSNYKTVGPIPFSPDIVGAALSGVAMFATKKSKRKFAAACLLGSAHAVITRMVGAKKFSIVQGPDGSTTIKEELPDAA